MTEKFLTDWHRIVANKDVASVRDLLAEDISMGAPPYWTQIQGRHLVHHLLGLIINTIEDFTYHREWKDGNELALEFTGHIGKLQLQGIDLITLNDSGVIQNLDVLMRPENAISKLRGTIAPQMAEFIMKQGVKAG